MRSRCVGAAVVSRRGGLGGACLEGEDVQGPAAGGGLTGWRAQTVQAGRRKCPQAHMGVGRARGRPEAPALPSVASFPAPWPSSRAPGCP